MTASSAGTALSPPSSPNLFVPTYLRARNFSHCSASMTLARIDLLALGRELDLGVLALDPILDEAALLQVVDVHIFDADGAAVVGLQHRDDLAHRRTFEARAPRRSRSDGRGRSGRSRDIRGSGRPGSRFGEGRAGRAWPRDGRARDRCGSASSRGWNLRRRGGWLRVGGWSSRRPPSPSRPSRTPRSSLRSDRGRG